MVAEREIDDGAQNNHFDSGAFLSRPCFPISPHLSLARAFPCPSASRSCASRQWISSSGGGLAVLVEREAAVERERERERARTISLLKLARCVARGRERERALVGEGGEEALQGRRRPRPHFSASLVFKLLFFAHSTHTAAPKPPPTTKLPFQLSTGLSSEYSRTPASESSSAGKGGAGGAAGGSGASSSSAKPGAGRRVADADASVYAKYYVNQILQLGEEGIKGAWARVS